MEEYLDKNKNGTVENQAVVDEMVKKNTFIGMWKMKKM